MDRSILLLAVLFFTLLLIGGVVLLMEDEGGREQPPAKTPTVETPSEPPEDEAPPPEPPEEITPPQGAGDKEPIPAELSSVPPSFRKSLGGFKGRVVEADGAPVPRIQVEVFGGSFHNLLQDADALMAEDPPPLSLKTVKTATAEDGTFLLPGAYPRTFYVLAVDPGGPRAFLRILDLLPGPGEVVDLGDIALPPFAVLVGTVLDDEGDPVAGTRVRATQLPAMIFLSGIQDFREGSSFLFQRRSMRTVMDPPTVFNRLFERLPVPVTRTGSDGAFRLEGVPLGLVNVVVDRGGFVTMQKGPLSTKKGGEKDLGTLRMDRGARAEGRVEDETGDPVPGIEIRVGTLHGFKEVVVLHPPVTADEKGRFALPGFPYKQAMAAARRYPEDPWTVADPFNPGGGPVVLTLPTAHDLEVKVLEPGGEPAEEAKLKLRHRDPMNEFFYQHLPPVSADRMERPDAGVFLIRAVPPGTYDVLATAPGFAVSKTRVEVRDGPAEETITLYPACAARVRVLDGTTRSPVEWAEVYTAREETDFVTSPNRVSRTRSDATGLAMLKKLAAGSYHVTVSHPGYALAVAPLEIPTEEEQVILLQPGGDLEGVVHPGPAGYRGPCMLILYLRYPFDGPIRYSPEAQAPRITATGADGRFRIRNLTPGTWRIFVERRLFHRDPSALFEAIDMDTLHRETVEVRPGETTFVDIFLKGEEAKLDEKAPTATGEISGKVILNGKPAAGARVICYMKSTRHVMTDRAGRYKLSGVPVGSGLLTASLLQDRMGLGGFSMTRLVTLVENIPLYEDFHVQTGSVTGRVVSGDGVVGLDREYLLLLEMDDEDAPYSVSMNAYAKKDGTFDFEHVPVGVYTLGTAEMDLPLTPVKNLKVFPGGQTGPIDLVRIPTVIVKGEVILPPEHAGLSYTGLWCTPLDGQGLPFTIVKVDKETGTFDTKRLLPGRYSAKPYRIQGAEVKFEAVTFEVPEGGTNGLVVIFDVIK